MALEPVGGGDAADHPYIPIGVQRTFRALSNGTFQPIVNVTAQSSLYGVQFTFTMKASTWDTNGGPPLTAERTAWVDQVCGHDHVQGFYTDQDSGPDGLMYNFAHIVVGTDDGAITDEAVVRMDQLNQQSTFDKIATVWGRLTALGAS